MSDGVPARGRFPAGFRFAAEEDFPRVEELWLEAFPEDTVGDVRDFLLSRYTAERILLRCEDGFPLAMASLFPVNLTGEKVVYVYALATDVRYRGRGLARTLLGAVQNAYGAALIVHPEPTGVARFYESNGFIRLPEKELKAMAAQNGIEDLLLDTGDGYIRPAEHGKAL